MPPMLHLRRFIRRFVVPAAERRKTGNFPLLFEEGWPRQQIKCRDATSYGADGVVIQFRQNFVETDHHPVCAAEEATQLFLDRAATPPRSGGESPKLHHLSCKPQSRIRVFRRSVAVFGLCIKFATALSAQTPISWNFIGPTTGPGRVLSVAVDPRNNAVMYVAAPGAGIFKTQDSGTTWAPQTDSTSTLQICSIVLDPRLPDVIYAGTGDDQSPRPGQGVERSTD